MKILSVIGARPNFIKVAPFIKAINDHNNSPVINPGHTADIDREFIRHILVHTGQHYDNRMSDLFFEELNIPEADINLGIGSGSHAEQVGRTMIEFEKVLKQERPDWVVVFGDVNATLACSVTAKKENIKCCHIEAGLRSGDMSMPEEINRIVTDRISDLLLVPDMISCKNLLNEGIPGNNICFVGNIMIDTLEANRGKAHSLSITDIINQNLIAEQPGTSDFKPETDSFAVMTLHRPSNVDDKKVLEKIVNFITEDVCSETVLIWTLHPRTRKMLDNFNLLSRAKGQRNLLLLEPLSYLEMLKVNMEAVVMLTDSGGLQEECTILGTPCITLRNNTERPVTLLKNGGVAVLAGNDVAVMREEFIKALGRSRVSVRPELWDGRTGERCLGAILGRRD